MQAYHKERYKRIKARQKGETTPAKAEPAVPDPPAATTTSVINVPLVPVKPEPTPPAVPVAPPPVVPPVGGVEEPSVNLQLLDPATSIPLMLDAAADASVLGKRKTQPETLPPPKKRKSNTGVEHTML